ncbi:MAG: hypothetical protein WA870_06375 [Methylovirgula sp.]
MTARIPKLLSDLSDTFWVVPALIVLGCVLAAIGLVDLDRSGERRSNWLSEDVRGAIATSMVDPRRGYLQQMTIKVSPIWRPSTQRPFACWSGRGAMCFRAQRSP